MLRKRWTLIVPLALLAAAVSAPAAQAGKPRPTPTPPPNPEILYRATVGQGKNTRSGLWKMNADGSNQTFVLSGIDWAAWSPDGTQMAVNSYGPPLGGGLYRIDADGSNPHLLDPDGLEMVRENPSWSPAPAGSPTHNMIAYTNHNKCSLMMVDASGLSAPVTLIQGDCNANGACAYLGPEWSRDGQVLAVCRHCYNSGPGTDALMIVPLFSPEQAYVLVDNVWAVRLGWARQHDWLTFNSDSSHGWVFGTWKLDLQLVDGRYTDPDGPTMLWTGWGAYAWSPDDSKLVDSRSGGIYSHDLATGLRTFLAGGDVPDWKR
jgi:hypothetical protein